MATRLITCRNMTLTQFAAELNGFFPGSPPITDATGISGRFDMTINFSQSVLVQPAPNRLRPACRAHGRDLVVRRIEGQLGLKVEKRKVMAPVLIVDQINDTPTEN
jgi:uncharacterized protein (TIGR03435 family)